MKTTVMSSMVLALGLSSPIHAIERPPSLDQNRPEEKPANRAVEVAEEVKEPGAAPEAAQPAAAWLGVFGERAGEALSAQLGVPGGVVLRYVAEDSPAAEAGLKVHDLLTTVDGQEIAGQNELRALVHDRKPGEEIRVGVVSGGVKSEKAVKLAERPAKFAPLPMLDDDRNGADQDVLPDLRRQMQQLNRLFPNDQQLQKQLEEQMKNMEEQLKALEKMPGLQRKMQLDDLIDRLPKQNNGVNFKALGSVELMDEQGSIKMKMRDGRQEVEVRDQAGELLYEGPWDTDQDKAAVAPEIRERIEKLNLKGNGIQFHLQAGPGVELELENGDAPPAADPAPNEDDEAAPETPAADSPEPR